MSELNSCFGILFPGVTVPDFVPPPLYPLKAIVSDDDGRLLKNELSSIHSDEVIWEYDGQEIEPPPEINVDGKNNDECIKDDEHNNHSDDDNDVAWEDDQSHENDSEEDQNLEISTAPYTLEIHLPMTAAGVETADNAIVLQALREISAHLTTHALPALEDWRRTLSAASGCYHSEHLDRKRKRDSQMIEENTRSITEVQKERIRKGLKDVCDLDREVQEILKTRCSRFLAS